jgi:hypothetical protein
MFSQSKVIKDQVGNCIYVPQTQSGPLTPPRHWVPFCCLLRLAGLLWGHSNPSPHGKIYLNNLYKFWDVLSSYCMYSLNTHVSSNDLSCFLLVNEYNQQLLQEAKTLSTAINSYLASLDLLRGHDNDTSILLPDHVPEVWHSAWETTLCCNVVFEVSILEQFLLWL